MMGNGALFMLAKLEWLVIMDANFSWEMDFAPVPCLPTGRIVLMFNDCASFFFAPGA
jgi:hypothetical protein